jgi:preprotein translocase subunit YajC
MNALFQLLLLADDAAPAAEGANAGDGGLGSFLSFAPLILVFVLFYVMIIAPQRRQQRERQDSIAKLKKNDEVVTSGGIYGRVVSITDERVVLKVDENARLTVHKSAIGQVLNAKPDEAPGGEST